MNDKTFQIVVQVVVLLFAVSFHESAHGWVAMKCGDNTARDLGRITLNPLKHIDPIGSVFFPLMLAFAGLPIFGWAKPVPISLRGVPKPRQANLLISGAGPVSNMLVAIGSAVVCLVLRLSVDAVPREVLVPLYALAAASVMVNSALAVFNLVPIPPLDGFGVLESLLPPSLAHVAIWLRRFGFILLAIVIFTGALGPLFKLVLGPISRWVYLQ